MAMVDLEVPKAQVDSTLTEQTPEDTQQVPVISIPINESSTSLALTSFRHTFNDADVDRLNSLEPNLNPGEVNFDHPDTIKLIKQKLSSLENPVTPGASYYSSSIDGNNGHIYQSAITNFQANYPDLTNDGIMGPATWAQLFLTPTSYNAPL